MQAVILCGGRGERLMPMTACTPAALLRILGKSVVAYTLDQLKKAGFKEATLALGYLGGQVIEEFESCEYKGMKLYFTSAEETGTAPAVAYAARNGEDILVCEANCVFDFDLNGIMDYHKAKKSEATFVTRQEPQTNKHICLRSIKTIRSRHRLNIPAPKTRRQSMLLPEFMCFPQARLKIMILIHLPTL